MALNILVVDSNEAFATMLKEMLEADGSYHVDTVYTGSEAVSYLRQKDVDLTIVDMGLESRDMNYQVLVEQVRRIRPVMRLMLIPLMGEDLPPEAHQLDIQGTLSKPFFADDLLPGIREALARQVSPRPSPTSPAFPKVGPESASAAAGIQAVLSDLARETRADAVLLVSASSVEKTVIAHISALEEPEVERLAELSIGTILAAQAVAQHLGQADAPFEHNMFEGGALRLYIMHLSEYLFLIVVSPLTTPLGTIRHNLRRAGRELADLALT
jgi:CheY-like chemotaxis protein